MNNYKTKRTGLRIRGNRVDEEVLNAVKRYAKWLRMKYEFPTRIPIYLSANEKVKALDGDLCYSIFFAPFEMKVEPYIRVATGDFQAQKAIVGTNAAILALLFDLTKQILHYFQWCKDGSVEVRSLSQKAKQTLWKYVEKFSDEWPEYK
jgi:DNA-directed RNA polymerase subunit L